MDILKRCCLIALVAVCAQPHLELKAQTSKPAKPNIIYILADDMGYGDLSSYGQRHFRTPTLDSLAAHGLKFTQHYAAAPVCAPSRAALMTGRDIGHSWIRGNYEKGPLGLGAGLPLRQEDITIAEVLKKAAYQTAIIGKWGLGMDGTSGHPNKKGFDYFYGYLNQAHAHNHYPEYLYRNEGKIQIPENANRRQEKFSSDLFTTEALGFLDRQQQNEPFFLCLAYITPHAEMIVPDDELFESFKGKFKEQPYTGKDYSREASVGGYGSSANPIAAYATMIVRLDRDIASIMNKLKEKGLDRNTIIMFSSDNGPHKEGGADPDILNSAGGLRGAKRDVYEGGIRVPFIVSGAGIEKDIISDHISGFPDILPTLAAYAGVNLQQNGIKTEGISLVPVLSGKGKMQKNHDYLYWEFHEGKQPVQALRKGKWKAVLYANTKVLELYNLETDRAERINVANQHPKVVSEFHKRFKSARTPNPYWKID
ncbi:arylsulfatase [Pedobacter sp. SAFR-022]|uniref:arylsulfatase n=1 Tax=Pedobacter sp. SAFR-022 TaxID=3436861 RepID=UPI003F820110